MRLGITLAPVRRKCGELEALKRIREAGFDCVDYSFHDMEPEWLEQDYLEYARRLREELERLGLKCTQAHAPFRFKFGGCMSARESAWTEIVRAMEAASLLGADCIVVHSVLTPAGVDLTQYNLRFFKSLEEYCARFQIRIGFENIFDYDPYRRCMGRFSTPGQVKAFLNELRSPWFTACLDVGHAAIAGERPENFIRGMDAETLRLLHIQDTDYVDDRHQLPYLGLHDWDEICRALAEIGYSGDFTFEIPGYLRRMPPELIPEALALAAAAGRHLIRQIEAARDIAR